MIKNETLDTKSRNMLINFQNKNFDKAKNIALSLTKEFSNFNLSWKILSHIYMIEGDMNEALSKIQQAVRINPKDPEAHNNLSLVYFNLNKFDEALKICEKAVEIKPDYAEVYFNMTVILRKLHRLEEAETTCRKAIKFKPNFTEAYSNLGIILHKLNRIEEAKFNYKKAIEINPNYISAHKNLEVLTKQTGLFDIIKKKTTISLKNNLFRTSRKVESGLIKNLYQINTKKLDDIDPEVLRYGNGESSDYNLFDTDNLLIKKLDNDLTNLIEKAIGSKIFIMESFFNIFKKGSGIIRHNHVSLFDKENDFVKNKFSLVYYLSVGDQSAKDPGILKLYDPEIEILPKDEMILIFPAKRFHKAIYSGQKERIMIGINFYVIS